MNSNLIPIGKDNMDALEDMFVKNNNSQIYLSAAASRYLGNPEHVVFMMDPSNTNLAIANAKDVVDEGVLHVRVTRRDDSEACRLAGVPKIIMRMVNGRIEASRIDGGVIWFKVKDGRDG